jgi:hypothetical protein
MKIISIQSFFQFGQGRGLIEPIARSATWKKMYWPLIGFAALFWIALFWMSFHFPTYE